MYAQNRKIGKPNNLKVFESNKTKGPKQDSHNRLIGLPRLIVKCLDLRNKLFNLYNIYSHQNLDYASYL
jgi:hypothetical protein